jgi:hypothetical protein
LRQCSSHYAIHAGRNLPDKELRYLRTLIVRAAVYRSFGRGREPPSLTYRHRAGVRLYTSSYEFAESCVFSKQLPEPLCCGLLAQAPLIPKLRGQFAEFLNHRSPERLRLLASPTCVSFSTVVLACGLFSVMLHVTSSSRTRPCGTGTSNRPITIHTTSLILRRRNINLPSIVYPFRARLRYRLTLGGFAFPRKP